MLQMMIRVKSLVVITLFVLQYLSTLVSSQDLDFSYLVLQWPVSYCDTKHSCCYPPTGKPDEDFNIHGLWPEYNTGKWPQNCKLNSSFDISQVSDLLDRLQKKWPSLGCPSADGTKFWSHEWAKHGTCSSLDQHSYFQAALDLNDKSSLLQTLKNAGIFPGDFYSVDSIKEAIEGGLGYEPYIQCNSDAAGSPQLFQIYLCVDASSSNFIKCPVFPTPRWKCNSSIEFPSFSSHQGSLRVVETELPVTS